MKALQLIKEQILKSKEKTDQLIKNIPSSKWNTTPSVLNTNMNWQIGHLILANYLHGIASLSGANEKVRKKIDLPNFIKFYGPKSTPIEFQEEKPTHQELIELYEFVFDLILKELETLSTDSLLQPTEIPNPSAATKYDALITLFTHQYWHNGQIAILNRVLL